MALRDAFIAVCVMSSRKHGTRYLGMTSNLRQRARKINLIERDNPHWNDLYTVLVF